VTPIIPLMVGDVNTAVEFSMLLITKGYIFLPSGRQQFLKERAGLEFP